MATIDVSELLSDPDFLDCFTVTRAVQTVDDTGRAHISTQVIQNIRGVVQPAGGRTLRMFPDLSNVSGTIDIYTQYRLEGPSDSTYADDVFWEGRDYTVATVQSFSNYGRGYVHAVATLKQLTAQSPTTQFIARGGP